MEILCVNVHDVHETKSVNTKSNKTFINWDQNKHQVIIKQKSIHFGVLDDDKHCMTNALQKLAHTIHKDFLFRLN